MFDYIVKRDNQKKKIKKIDSTLDGIHIKPKLKRHKSLIEINEIIAIQSDLKKNILMKKFEKMYRKLFSIMLDITESSDATTSDCIIALNEASKIESMIERELKKELKQKEYEKLQKKLALVEGKIQNKLLEIRTNEMLRSAISVPTYEEERGKSR